MSHATRPWLALAALALSSWLAACTDAGLCVRGEEGCACTADDSCDGNLSCRDGMCVTGGGGDPDAGRDAGGDRDAGTPDAGGGDAGTPTDCGGDSLEAACQSFCENFCQNQGALCVDSACRAGDCDTGGDVLTACINTCDDASCANSLCELEKQRRCENYGVESDGVFESLCLTSDPACVLLAENGCANTCGSNRAGSGGDFANDGMCDDGADGMDQFCPRGTDCTDCEDASNCRQAGDTCEENGDCCGYFFDEEAAGAFCVELDGGARCLLACTRTGECPGDTTCVATSDGLTSVCAP